MFSGLAFSRFAVIVLAITVMTVPTLASADSSQRKPTIVLVHGAWADGSSWSHIIPILQREHYTVVAPPNPLRGLTRDAAYLASYLSTISGPIVLVGHSGTASSGPRACTRSCRTSAWSTTISTGASARSTSARRPGGDVDTHQAAHAVVAGPGLKTRVAGRRTVP